MPSHSLGSASTDRPVHVGALFPVGSRSSDEIMYDPNRVLLRARGSMVISLGHKPGLFWANCVIRSL